MKKLIILLIVLLLCPILSFGQTNTITLVASGDGATKTEAESMALRSAIEQAFGTFVSANTTILNDEIVKDEIATISSGNIESYSIVAESETGGRWYVSVKAVVSINKLVDYAKSHGASTEFAGQNFAMQMKMRKLNKENEEKALSDLLSEVERITSNVYCFDYEIEQGEPLYSSDSKYNILIKVSAKSNQNAENIEKMILTTFESLALTESEQISYRQNIFPMTQFQPIWISSGSILPSFWMRSDEEFLGQFAQRLKKCLLKNLNSFYIVRNGSGEQLKKILMPARSPKEKITRENMFISILVMSEDLLFQTEGFAVKPDFGIINESAQLTGGEVSNSNTEEDEEEAIPFPLVEEKPKFQGGDTNQFSNWVESRVKYYSQIAEITGQSGPVMVQFIVNTHGYVTNVKILRSISSSVDNMVLGIISSSPIWEPGRQRGKAVSVLYTFTIKVN